MSDHHLCPWFGTMKIVAWPEMPSRFHLGLHRAELVVQRSRFIATMELATLGAIIAIVSCYKGMTASGGSFQCSFPDGPASSSQRA